MKRVLASALARVPLLRAVLRTRGTFAPITLRTLFWQKILGFNRRAYWPMHFTSVVHDPTNIVIGAGCAPGLSPGCYIQGRGGIDIGEGTIIGPNVGIISANHDPSDFRCDIARPVIIGRHCWIGMNAVILPGVVIGDHTIVGAGAVVTRPFPEGRCVIAGNPARVLRALRDDECTRPAQPALYHGFVPSARFDRFRARRLKARA